MADINDIGASPSSIYSARSCTHCKLDRRNARIFMGQKEPFSDKETAFRFEAMASECESALPVIGTWRTFEIESDFSKSSEGKGCILKSGEDSLFLPGNSISRHLKDATNAVLMAFTLGMDYERMAVRFDAQNPFDALVFDACASSLVESGADFYQDQIEDRLGRIGYEACGVRYSPGFGDLPLSVQPEFIDTLDAGRNIGLFANDDFFLTPKKSITAILGIRPAGPGIEDR